jgi:hypothetical protein
MDSMSDSMYGMKLNDVWSSSMMDMATMYPTMATTMMNPTPNTSMYMPYSSKISPSMCMVMSAMPTKSVHLMAGMKSIHKSMPNYFDMTLKFELSRGALSLANTYVQIRVLDEMTGKVLKMHDQMLYMQTDMMHFGRMAKIMAIGAKFFLEIHMDSNDWDWGMMGMNVEGDGMAMDDDGMEGDGMPMEGGGMGAMAMEGDGMGDSMGMGMEEMAEKDYSSLCVEVAIVEMKSPTDMKTHQCFRSMLMDGMMPMAMPM